MNRAIAMGIVFVGSVSLLAQADGPALSQRLITFNAAAVDAKGDPVTDLRATDVQLREDRKPRPIAFFHFAGTLHTPPPHAEGEFVNRPTPIPTVILFDRWNDSMVGTTQAWIGLGAALQRLENVENVYIYYLTAKGDLAPVYPLPNSGPILRGASPTPAELRAKLDGAVQNLQGFRTRDDFTTRVNITFTALANLFKQTGSVAGRKNLIWVTQGVPLEIRARPSNAVIDLTTQVRNLSELAAQSQIAIYCVDQSTRGAGANMIGQAKAALQLFSSLTGGRWYPSDSFNEALTGASTDARGNYQIGYYPSPLEKNGKPHKIAVESTRKGIRLLAREEIASPPDPDQTEVTAIGNQRRSPIDAMGIGLRVAMSHTPGPQTAAGTNHFSIRADPADLLIERTGEGYRAQVDVTIVTYAEGFLKESSPPTRLTMKITQEGFDHAAKDGLIFAQDEPVSDEAQQVRVIVYDPMAQNVGSVTFPAK